MITKNTTHKHQKKRHHDHDRFPTHSPLTFKQITKLFRGGTWMGGGGEGGDSGMGRWNWGVVGVCVWKGGGCEGESEGGGGRGEKACFG